MIAPGGLLLVVPHIFVCPSFSFIREVAKEYITKLECEKYFHRVTYSAPLEMLLQLAQKSTSFGLKDLEVALGRQRQMI